MGIISNESFLLNNYMKEKENLKEKFLTFSLLYGAFVDFLSGLLYVISLESQASCYIQLQLSRNIHIILFNQPPKNPTF